MRPRRDPIRLFKEWYSEAEASGMVLPESMALATATAAGRPSVRMVLLRGFGAEGFDFYTNYESRKASELAGNPYAALLFHWPALERQVRIEGRASRLSAAESNRYFQTRARESRVSAWASPQSRVIPSRRFLEAKVEAMQARFADGDVPCPPFWGGYRVVPRTIEFWQGQLHRLHERVLYRRVARAWKISHLAP